MHTIAEKLSAIEAELKALPERLPSHDFAAYVNGITAILHTLRDAGHHVPEFMTFELSRMVQPVRLAHPHTVKEFSVRSDLPGERNPAGYTERMKRLLPIALIEFLINERWSPALAVHRVAAATGIAAKKLRIGRKEAGRDRNSDWKQQLRDATRHVQWQYSKLCEGRTKPDALTALIAAIALKLQE